MLFIINTKIKTPCPNIQEHVIASKDPLYNGWVIHDLALKKIKTNKLNNTILLQWKRKKYRERL